MKSFFALTVFIFLGLSSFAQPSVLQSNDTASIYYSKTDFNLVDSLPLWTYKLEKDLLYNSEDSIQPLCKLTFSRSEPINNYSELFKQLDSVAWKVHITYKVYRLSDSDYCYIKSAQVRQKTNFVPPFAGGDYFIIGKFIFLNTEDCIACIQYKTTTDYCRPVVNALISKIDRSRPFSVDGIVRQFPIKRTYVEPPPKWKKSKYRR